MARADVCAIYLKIRKTSPRIARLLFARTNRAEKMYTEHLLGILYNAPAKSDGGLEMLFA